MRFIALLLMLTTPAAAQTTQPVEPVAGNAVYVGDELLRDYKPQSTLVTPVTTVAKAKFPAIDIHCHWNADLDPHRLLAAMDALGVSHAVNLSGGFGKKLDEMLTKFGAPSGGRLIVFANLDFSRIDEPSWSDDGVHMLRDGKANGLGGLKFFKDFGLTVKDKSGTIVRVDDPRLSPIFEACAELKLPVLIHSADPVAFFRPTDQFNERWMQLKRHPGWSFFGPGVPSWDEVIAQRNRMIGAHPRTTFVVAHMAESANDYAQLGRWLDEHPNLFVDMSGRENEIGRQPFASRRFFVTYADRVLFGTDRYPGRPDQPRYNIYFRMLETQDEYFDYYDHGFAPAGEWKIYGLALPDDVLSKVYRDNAVKVLNLKTN